MQTLKGFLLLWNSCWLNLTPVPVAEKFSFKDSKECVLKLVQEDPVVLFSSEIDSVNESVVMVIENNSNNKISKMVPQWPEYIICYFIISEDLDDSLPSWTNSNNAKSLRSPFVLILQEYKNLNCPAGWVWIPDEDSHCLSLGVIFIFCRRGSKLFWFWRINASSANLSDLETSMVMVLWSRRRGFLNIDWLAGIISSKYPGPTII